MNRIDQLKEYLKKNPEDNFLQHALALEYIKINNDSEAQKLFEGILQREPGYLGSYYHLGKLLERTGDLQRAMDTYQKGMEVAKAAKDSHAYNEMQAAFDDAKDESDSL